MARLWHSGFELNSLSNNVEFDNIDGSPTIQTSVVRSGTYALKISSLASATRQGVRQNFKSVASNGPFFIRACFRFDTLPTAQNTILYLSSTSGIVIQASITIDNTGALRLYNGTSAGTLIGSPSSNLTTGRFYVLELKFDNTGGAAAGILEAKIDGVVFATSSVQTLGAGIRLLGLGGNGNAEAQTTGVWYIDDIAINDNTGAGQTSYPGFGSLLRLQPNAAGENTQWTIGGSIPAATNWQSVNEVTPDDGVTFISSKIANQEDLYALPASGIPSASVINVVAVGWRLSGSAAANNTSAKLEIEKASGGTILASAAMGTGDTTWKTNQVNVPRNFQLVTYTDPDGGAWTQSTLDTMHIGIKVGTVNTNSFQLSTIWASIDYVPTSNKTITGVTRITATTNKTVTGVSRIQKTTTKTITGISRIQEYGGCVIDQQQTTELSDEFFGRTFVQQLGQSFIPGFTGQLCQVLVRLAKAGSPTDNIQCQIYSDNSGVPGTLLKTATNTIAAASLGGASTNQIFSFAEGFQLVSGTSYWIVLSRTSSLDNTNFFSARKAQSNSIDYYANGKELFYNGSNWVNTGFQTFSDIYFVEYYNPLILFGTSRITALTTKTITGKTAIQETITRIITGVSRIQELVAKIISGLSRIREIVNKTITGLARITAMTTRTITGVTRITATTIKTITGISRITALTSQLITGKSRIQEAVTKTLSGLARIQEIVSKTITGKTRITATTNQNITGKSDIQETTTKTLSGISRIREFVLQVILGVTRIMSKVNQTITGKTRITATTTQNIIGKGDIRKTTTRTTTGISRIQLVRNEDLQGHSRVTARVMRTVTGLADIRETTIRDITGKAKIIKAKVNAEYYQAPYSDDVVYFRDLVN